MTARSIRILGVDPGFANTGYAVYRIDVAPGGAETHLIERAGLIWTERSDRKRKVRAADDNTRRLREVARALNAILQARPVQAICVESMSFPRNASSAAKIALTWGVVGCLSETQGIPIVEASPQEIKLALCGKKTASKEEVLAEVERRVGATVVPLLRDQHGQAITARTEFEHPFDALAAVFASLDSEVLRMARKVTA